MKTKILLISSLLGVSFTNAWSMQTFVSDTQTVWENNINQVQYIGWWDWKTSYWGFFISPSRDPLSPVQEIEIKNSGDISFSDKLQCRGQLRWYFWSAARGNMLMPLSKKDLENLQNIEKTRPTDVNKIKYADMNIEGWIFSDCNDQYLTDSWHNTLIWAVKVLYKNIPNFSLYAWRQYDLTWNRVISEPSQVNWGKIKFVWNFQLKDNKMPIGFLYDSAFWIGFAGWVIDRWLSDWVPKLIDNLNHYDSHIDILNEIKKVEPGRIYLKDSSDWVYTWPGGIVLTRGWPIEIIINTILWVLASDIKADWLVWVSNANSLNEWDIAREIIKSQRLIIDEKTQWDSVTTLSKNYGISDIVNIARQKANILCRWKWTIPNWWTKVNITQPWTYCYDTQNIWTKFIIDTDLTQTSDTNIFIKWSPDNFLILESNQIWSHTINAFVDRWYLLLSNDITLTNIWPLWTLNDPSFNFSWSYIRWNFVINWIMAWVDKTWPRWYENPSTDLTGYNHRLLIEWTLASFNTLWILKTSRKDTLDWILWLINWESLISSWQVYDRTPIRKVTDSSWVVWVGWANWALVWQCQWAWTWSDGTDCRVPNSYSGQTLPATAWYIKADSANKSILFD